LANLRAEPVNEVKPTIVAAIGEEMQLTTVGNC